MEILDSLKIARQLDEKDSLRKCRNEFHIPKNNGKPVIYFCGNSLGLQPKSTKKYIQEELEDWAKFGVEGHFHAQRPWFGYHHFLTKGVCEIVGAKKSEVVVMNNLTVNLHLLMVSFYQPKGKKIKIIMEAGAFPSDQYAIESHVKARGLDPAKVVVEISPRPDEYILRKEDILNKIKEIGSELALVLMGGVNYYTGQFYPLEEITSAAHQEGAIAGFDLAHAAGNIPLNLHDWNVDFAVWCSYKYLNSGPGGTSGVFIHEKHVADATLPRFAGWWGYDEKKRFKMEKGFIPTPTAEGWQLSNAQILPMAAHLASLKIFQKAGGMTKLRKKSVKLTGFLIELLSEQSQNLRIITPIEPEARGCQISVKAQNGKKLFQFLAKKNFIVDWREPDVIRISPVPLYNSFIEIAKLARAINQFYKK